MMTVESGITRPLAVTLDVCEIGPEHVGYRVHVPVKGDGTVEPVTIASVAALYARPGYVRLTFAEYPGYHYDLTGRTMLCAVVELVRPAESEAHPDLIDRSHDVWRWYEGYGLNDPGLWDRSEVESNFGPVRNG